MAKVNVYKIVNPPKVNSAAPTEVKNVGAALTANMKSFNRLGLTFTGISKTTNGLANVSAASLKESKLKEISDRRAAQREEDRKREEEFENRKSLLPERVKKEKPTSKEKSWLQNLFEGMFGWLKPLALPALAFLGSLFTLKAVEDIRNYLNDPNGRARFVAFFEKLGFVLNKLKDFASWLIKDNLLEGFSKTFGENKTVSERLQGIGQMLIGIIGLKALLNPFGLIRQVMGLMQLRSRELQNAQRRLRQEQAANAALRRQLERGRRGSDRTPERPSRKPDKPDKTRPDKTRPDKTKPTASRPGGNAAQASVTNRGGGTQPTRSGSAAPGYRDPGRYRAPGQARAGGTFASQQARKQLPGPQGTRPGLRRFGTDLNRPTYNPRVTTSLGRASKSFDRRLLGQAGVVDTARNWKNKRITLRQGLGDLGRSGARGIYRLPGNVVRGTRLAARATRSVARTTTAPFRATARFGGNLLNKAGALGKFVKGPLAKVFGNIPFLGAALYAIFNLLKIDENDNVTLDRSKLGQTAFQTVGLALGSAIGSFIPIPVVGTVLGGMIGEFGGELVYDLYKGTPIKIVGKKIVTRAKQWWKTTVKAGEMLGGFMQGLLPVIGDVGKWVGSKVTRLYQATEKIKLRDFIAKPFHWILEGFGKLADLSFPNPLQFYQPDKLLEFGRNAYDAIFTEKPIRSGEDTKPKTKLPTSEIKNASEDLKESLGTEINKEETLASQIKRNFGYKVGQNFYFNVAGRKYRAKLESDGWHLYYDELFAYREIPTDNGQNTWLANAFVKAINTPEGQTRGRNRSTANEDFIPAHIQGTKEANEYLAERNKTQLVKKDGIWGLVDVGPDGKGIMSTWRRGEMDADDSTIPPPAPELPSDPLNPTIATESTPLSLTGVAKQRVGNDTEFLNGLVAMSRRLGVNPGDMLAKMASESSLMPNAQNQKTRATGLIQMTPETAASLGTSIDALQKMSRAEQLPYIEKFLKQSYAGVPRPITAGHLYTGTFLPAFIKAPADAVIATKSGTGIVEGYGSYPAETVRGWYARNEGLDKNKDGKIQIFELGERIANIKKDFGIAGGVVKGSFTTDTETEAEVAPQTPLVSQSVSALTPVLDIPPGMSEDLKNVTANHGSLRAAPTKDIAFKAGKGDKSRRIFLHWTGGFSNQPSGRYHTTFTGDGKANRNTENYGIDLGDHTGGANTNSVGLSIAAMGHQGMTANYYDEKKGWAENPPTGAQIQSMALEAARLAHAWGWDVSTIQSNVRTHGEWERYGTSAGILSGRPQRWDLDQLRPGQPFDQTETISNGGNEMRALITAYFNKIKQAEAQGSERLDTNIRQSAATPTPILQLPEGVVLTSEYGVMRGDKMHGGTDIAAPAGTDLVAPVDGTIVDYGSLNETGAKRGDPNGWGNFIVLKDKNGRYHLYGHILDGFTKSGAVKEGQKIADVGSTGMSTAPHLHWELGTNWTGGVLEGKSDPLQTYRLEAPFIGQSMRGAATGIPTETVPGLQQQNTASVKNGVLLMPPSLAKGQVPVADGLIPEIIKLLQEGSLKPFQTPSGFDFGSMLGAGVGAITDFGRKGFESVSEYFRGGSGAGTSAGSGDGTGTSGTPATPQKDPISGYAGPTNEDPWAYARSKAPLEYPLIETYNTLSRQWSDVLGIDPDTGKFKPRDIDGDDIRNNYYGGRSLSVTDGLRILGAKLTGREDEIVKDGNLVPFDLTPPPEAPRPERPNPMVDQINQWRNRFGFSSGGNVTPLPNNLPGFFFKAIGNFFKGVGKAISKAFNSVKKAVLNITQNPIFKIITTAVSIFVPPLAPVIAGINAVSSLMQGDIIGAVTGAFGALGGAFPGTFGAEGTFFQGINNVFGKGLGGVVGGFLTGGIGGALGGVGALLPQGIKDVFKGFGSFMDKNPQIGKILSAGIAKIPGLGAVLGPALQGAGLSPTMAIDETATQSGALISSLINVGLGLVGKAMGLEQGALSAGINPAAFGIPPNKTALMDPKNDELREMAQMGPIETMHIPIIIEKLVAIQEPVPIIITKNVPAPQQPKQPQKK